MALFSIITTCFHAQSVIEKTIRSVLSQDFRDFEYLIMDGMSQDRTYDIAISFTDAFQKAGIPFHVFREQDRGIYEGMNHAVSHASGTYINFMNADDVFLHSDTLSGAAASLTKYLKSAESALPDILYGDAAAVEFGRTYPYVKDLSLIERKMPFSHQSVFAKRALLEKYPFRERFRIGADYDFLLSVYRNGGTFYDLGLPVCKVTLDGLSSRDLLHTFVETTQIQKEHGISHYSEKAYRKKLKTLKIKQFVMDHFPGPLIALIRKIQRISRGQNAYYQD